METAGVHVPNRRIAHIPVPIPHKPLLTSRALSRPAELLCEVHQLELPKVLCQVVLHSAILISGATSCLHLMHRSCDVLYS